MAKDSKDNKKEKKQGRRHFWQGVLSETKRVNWPDATKTKQAVSSVFFVIVMFSLVIWLIDTFVYGGLSSLGFYGHSSTEVTHVTHTASEPVNPTSTSPEAGK